MVLGTLALALVAIIYIMTRTPEMRTLFANLPEADKAAVVEALQAANFDPAVDSLTGSVQVPAGDYQKARMMMRSKESSVGTKGVRQCTYRGMPYHSKQNT